MQPSDLTTTTIEIPEPTVDPTLVDGIKVATFLGSETRRYYGEGPVPEKLEVIWRTKIGSGLTSGKGGGVTWSGTGWTGQPALVREEGRLYLYVGGFDHNLHKIDATTGDVVWEYKFEDVIKGSPTVFENPSPTTTDDAMIVVVGSRRGYPMSMGNPAIAPLRAVAAGSGRELWRLPVPRTKCYSQDADSSPFFLDGYLYVAVESGYLYKIDPTQTEVWGSYRKPKILGEVLLLGDSSASSHGGNLVLEASPAYLDGVIYIASGSGHIYGVRAEDMKIVYDYKTGSDLDGTTSVTSDGYLLAAIEKQYISGKGGVMKLDPKKAGAESVVWYFPTENRSLSSWLGGVIGSPTMNDEYNDGSKPSLVAFTAIDGNLYVVSQSEVASGTVVSGPNGEKGLATPVRVFKDNVGGAISTPIIVGDHIVAAGYDAMVHVYRIDYGDPASGGVVLPTADGSARVSVTITEVATFTAGGSYESTPIVWDGRVYIGSRDGFFYSLGDPDLPSSTVATPAP